MSVKEEIEDLRFQWFKHIVYKTLAIDFSDSAFEDLLKRDKVACESLISFFCESNEIKPCVFFYCTVEEEEVEVEDVYDQIEDVGHLEVSESSESEKSGSDDSIDAKTEEGNEDAMHKADSPEIDANAMEGVDTKRLQRSSTTSLLKIIKKNVLHICLNIATFIPSQRYVYFLKCKLDMIPILDTLEEVFNIMPDFFEIGSINQHPLIAMKKVISHIYLPILKDKNWLSFVPPTKCEMDKNKLSSVFNELCRDIEEFLTSTEETISHIEKPIMFKTPDFITSSSIEELAQEQSFVEEAKEFVKEWTEMISDLLEKAIQQKPPENSLLGEINFWKRQKLILSTCYDHLNKCSIQQTIQVLKTANRDLSEFEEQIKDVEIHLKTASDNFSYLSLLEPLRKNLLPEKSFEDTQKTVEDMFLLIKMIWLQSNYYKEIPNMCRLIKGIATLLKENVKSNANVETLFRKPLPEVKRIVTNSIAILQFWKSQYLKECENVKKYGGCYWWGFEISVFFTETDHIIYVCSDLDKITVMLEQLYNIFNTNLKYFVQDVKGLSVLEVRVFGITSRIQYANFDVYDPAYRSQWDKILSTFLRDVHNFEDEIKLYISKMFRSTLSFENAYILTKSFNKIAISPTIQDFINKSRDDMLKQFIREIFEKENEFLSYKDEPPPYLGIPETISSVIWVQDLLLKLSQPISQIIDRNDLSKKELEVMERFQKTELLLKEYKLEKFDVWKDTATEKLNKFLQGKVLKKFKQESSSLTRDSQRILLYQVNFPIYLEEVSIEAKLFEYFGFEIPFFIKNVVLQERLYYEHRHEIRITLENLKKSISTLNKYEISILGIPIENLCSVLDLGLTSMQWESSDIFDFVKKVKRAEAVFRNLINQIKNVFTEIDKRIESLSNCDLFQFDLCENVKVPTCEEFFADAQTKMEMKTEKIIDIHTSLQLLLKNLEKITCKTTSGEAIQMKQYYQRCEEKILASLLKMTLSNLNYFKDEVLENYIFRYIELASQAEDQLVTSSLYRAELILITFIRNAIESTRKIIRWLNGTCIPSPTFQIGETKDQMEFSYYLDICMHPNVKDITLNILNSFFNFINKIHRI